MNLITTSIIKTYRWAEKDYHEWPSRFIIEVVAWVLSIGCSFIMAMTAPHPPLLLLYPAWIAGCAIYAWAAWTRGSTGMLANYILLTLIDGVGFLRMITT
jgi:hypothetical protein